MLREYLSNLANQFRRILNTTDKINAQDFESKIVDVFSKGHQAGETAGYQVGLAEGIEQGKPLGKLELLQDSEYMNAKVSGTAIAVNDVNSIEHSVGCSVASKNLFDGTISKGLGLTGSGNNRTVYADNTAGYKILKVEPNTTYCISGDYKIVADGYVRVASFTEYPTENSVSNLYSHGSNVVTFTTTATDNYLFFWFVLSATSSTTDVNIQLEKSSTATEYTPYVADVGGIDVKQYGNNLLIYPYFENGNKTVNGITYTDNGNGTLTANGTATGVAMYYLSIYLEHILEDGKTYVLSGSKPNVSMLIQYKEIATGTNSYIYDSQPFTVDKSRYVYGEIRYQVPNGATLDNVVLYPQIQIGTTVTTYEPYIEPTTYQSTANGTVEGVTSISPNMTLLSNNNGVVINANYLRDIDTYIDNLITNVALTGGE